MSTPQTISEKSKRWKNLLRKLMYKNCSIRRFGEAYVKYEILYMPDTSLSSRQLQRDRVAAREQLRAELDLPVSVAKMSTLCYKFRWTIDNMIADIEAEKHNGTETELVKGIPAWAREMARRLGRAGAGAGGGAGGRRSCQELARLARALAERGWERRTADPVGGASSALQLVWEQICELATRKLRLLRSRGDTPGPSPAAVLTSDEWRVADLLLAFGEEAGSGAGAAEALLDGESVRLYEQLHPLVSLFHLVQQHGVEEEGGREERARRWSQLVVAYGQKGYTASLVMLQRRWYELKLQARNRLLSFWKLGKEGQEPEPAEMPVPLHASIARRYPHVVIQPIREWAEMVRAGDVFLTLCPDQTDVPDSNVQAEADPVIPYSLEHQALDDAQDDLILIENHIETIEVDDENDDHDEEGDRLVIDEQQNANDSNNLMEVGVNPGNIIRSIKTEAIDTYELVKEELTCQQDALQDAQPEHSNLGIGELEQVDPSQVQAIIIFDSDEEGECNGVPAVVGDTQNTFQANSNTEITKPATVKREYSCDGPDEGECKKIKCDNSESSFKVRIKFEDDIITNSNETDLIGNGGDNERDGNTASETTNNCEESGDSEINSQEIDEKLLMDTRVQLVRLEHTDVWQEFNNEGRVAVEETYHSELAPAPVERSSRGRAVDQRSGDSSESPSEESECDDEVVFKSLRQSVPDGLSKSRRSVRATRWMVFTETDKKLYGNSTDHKPKLEPESETESSASAKRVAKRVELSNIEEVRRINRNILTAQVAPLLADQATKGNEAECEGAAPAARAAGVAGSDHGAGGELPTAGALRDLLERLARAGGAGVAGGRGPYCCPARRDRAIADARRRMAERAGRQPAPPAPHRHRAGACGCCCLHLLAADTAAQLAAALGRLARSVRALLHPDHPQRQDILNVMGDTSPQTTSQMLKASKSKDKSGKRNSQPKPSDPANKPQSPDEDCGYAEWLQQRNLCTKYFQLRGSAIDKISKPAANRNRNPHTDPSAPEPEPVAAAAPILDDTASNTIPTNNQLDYFDNPTASTLTNLSSNVREQMHANKCHRLTRKNLRKSMKYLANQNKALDYVKMKNLLGTIGSENNKPLYLGLLAPVASRAPHSEVLVIEDDDDSEKELSIDLEHPTGQVKVQVQPEGKVPHRVLIRVPQVLPGPAWGKSLARHARPDRLAPRDGNAAVDLVGHTRDASETVGITDVAANPTTPSAVGTSTGTTTAGVTSAVTSTAGITGAVADVTSTISTATAVTDASDVISTGVTPGADVDVISTVGDVIDAVVSASVTDDSNAALTASNVSSAVTSTDADVTSADAISTSATITSTVDSTASNMDNDNDIIAVDFSATVTAGGNVMPTVTDVAGSSAMPADVDSTVPVICSGSQLPAVSVSSCKSEKKLNKSVRVSRQGPVGGAPSLSRPVELLQPGGPAPAHRKSSRSLLRPKSESRMLGSVQGVQGVQGVQPLGGLVNAADYIEGRDPISLQVLCKDANTPFWVLSRQYLVLNSCSPENEFESPEYYTFDCMERCARLVFPKPRQLRAPGELCVANRCYKKMCDEPIRYAQVYFVVPDVHECKRLVLAGTVLHVFCMRTAVVLPLQPRRMHNDRLVGLHCAALPAIQELVYQFNHCEASKKSPRTIALPSRDAGTGSGAKRSGRTTQWYVNKRANLAQFFNCVTSNNLDTVELDSDTET